MPAKPLAARHRRGVEDHGTELVRLVALVEEATEDGFVDPGEQRLLLAHAARALASFRPLPIGAGALDRQRRLRQAIEQTGGLTPWVLRLARELGEEEERL